MLKVIFFPNKKTTNKRCPTPLQVATTSETIPSTKEGRCEERGETTYFKLTNGYEKLSTNETEFVVEQKTDLSNNNDVILVEKCENTNDSSINDEYINKSHVGGDTTYESSGLGASINTSSSEIYENNNSILFSLSSSDNENQDDDEELNENTTLSNLSNSSLLTISEVSTLDENEAARHYRIENNASSTPTHNNNAKAISDYSSSASSSSSEDQDESIIESSNFEKFFMPKKSCLSRKTKLSIDTTTMEVNATSSPLITPASTPSSPLSLSSISTTSTSSTTSYIKKRVSFADFNGKGLRTINFTFKISC